MMAGQVKVSIAFIASLSHFARVRECKSVFVLCKRFFLLNFTHFLKNDNCIQVATKIILIIHFDNKHKFNGYFLFSVFFLHIITFLHV